MIHLLDANVLIALGDSNHQHRAAVLRFFQTHATIDDWATCPLTENAFIRILGGNHYPGSPGSTAEARRLLNAFKAAPGHQFWPTIYPSPIPVSFPNCRRPSISPTPTSSRWR
jgi:uncharacterized protein